MFNKKNKKPLPFSKIFYKILEKQRGSISIFLSGLLVISLFSGGLLIDYSRISTAKAELRSSMQMASHTMLSAFDKKIAREFGLFALREDFDFSETLELLEDRLKGNEHDLLQIKLVDNKIKALEDQRLSLPPVLEKQIVQMMEWQIPRLFLSKIMEEYKLLDSVKNFAPVFKAKINYEKQLQGLQKAMTKMSNNLKELADLIDEGEKIYKGLSPINEEMAQLAQAYKELDNNLLLALEKGLNDSEENETGDIEISQLISRGNLSDLKFDFQRLMNLYYEKRDRFRQERKSMNLLLSNEAQAEEKMKISNNEAGVWKEKLNLLEKGPIAQNMYSDYYSKILVQDSSSFEEFSKEMKLVGEKLNKRTKAWEEISIGGETLNNLRFSDWFNKRLGQIEKDNGSLIIQESKLRIDDPDLLPQGQALSQDSLRFQANIHSQAEQNRSSLAEFISAWNKKRKAISQAKKLQKMELGNLHGGIHEILGSEIMEAYNRDYTADREISLNLPLPSSDMKAADESFDLIETFLSLLSLMDKDEPTFNKMDEKYIRVLTYWSHMFSHKLSKKFEEKGVGRSRSLTNFPLKERKVYGGELEYILLGRNIWYDNLLGVELRISALRLLFNMIYAFSSASLYAESSSLAMALAGWSGFGVPFVQSAILILLSIGETAYDIQRLNRGEKLPLLKNSANWAFSISGIKEIAGELTKDIFDNIEIEISSGLEAGSDQIGQGIKNINKSVKESLDSALRQPIMRLAEEIIRSAKIYKEEEIEKLIAEYLAALKESAGSGKSSEIINSLFSKADKEKKYLASIINSALEDKESTGQETESVIKNMQADINSFVDSISNKFDGALDDVTGYLEKELTGLNNLAREKAEQKIGQVFNSYNSQLGGGMAMASSSIGSAINMDYEDYINLFLFLFSLQESSKNKMLSNTAKLIHAETMTTDLSKAGVEFEWEAEAYIPTLFLSRFSKSGLNIQGKKFSFKEKWREGYGKNGENN